MTTIHSNSPRDALSRLEVMIAMTGFEIPIRAIRQHIASAMQLVIQAQRLTGGRRKIINVSEITGMEGDQIQMHDVFLFEQYGVDEAGHATGRFISTGIRPRISERMEHFGIEVPPEVFQRAVL